MKKVLLGSSMLFSGIIGIVGLLIARAMNNDSGSALDFVSTQEGWRIFFWIFIIISIVGLFIGISGAFSNKNE